MATNFRIFKNDGAGGPVDYGTVISSTASLSYLTAVLAPGSDTTFAVRAFDTVSGLEELNSDARVRIVLDGAGVDVTARPGPPSFLAAHPVSATSVRISFAYNPAGQGASPTGFRVWLTVGGSVNYAASPDATVAYVRDELHYSATVTGLAAGTAYAVGVRAYNASGNEPNTRSASVTTPAGGPAPVNDLAGSTTFDPT